MGLLNRMRIGTRLAAAFAIVLGLLAVVAAIGAIGMTKVQGNVDYFRNSALPSFKVISDISAGSRELRRLESQHLMVLERKDAADLEKRIDKAITEMNAALARYKDFVADPQDEALWKEVQRNWSAYSAGWPALRDVSLKRFADPKAVGEAQALMFGPARQRFSDLTKSVDAFWAYNEKLVQDSAAAAERDFDRAIKFLAGLAATALVLAIGLGWILARSITEPMRQAVALARRVAEGDLSAQIEPRGSDETAQLLRALKDMNDGLAKVVGSVRSSSDSIATAAGQIASGNVDLSQRTEEQASNLQQTAASMAQLTGTVKATSETARSATALAGSASAAATRGGEVVGQVVSTMQEISESSRRISEITTVIDGIAFQTNILALNAAVEAARAGDQGRGFAVVAGEVRALAQRSAEAAREIKVLIGASVDKVESGARLVGDAGASMQDIVEQVRQVTELITRMGVATEEQTSGIDQVSNAVTQLDQVTQQNAALVEESAAAADSLRQQADRLVQAVGVFKLAQEFGGHGQAIAVAATSQQAAREVIDRARKIPGAASASTKAPARERPARAPRDAAAKPPAPAPASGDAPQWDTF